MPSPSASVSTTFRRTGSWPSGTSRARLWPSTSLSPAKYETSDDPAENRIANGTIATPAVELPPRMSPKMNETATTSTVNAAMSTTVRHRFWACASYIETRGTKIWPPGCVIALAELHLRDRAVGLVRELEVLLRREAEHPGEDVRRERLERGVVVAAVAVVEAAGERDLVLGRGEVLRQVLELLHGLQLRVILRDREQRTQRAGEDVLGLGHLLRRSGGAGGHGRGAGLRDLLERPALVRGVALHGLEQVRDEV